MRGFVATIKVPEDFSVSFCELPIVDGVLVDGVEKTLLSECDEYDDFIFEVLEPNEIPTDELKKDMAGILTRRFEAAQEYLNRQAPAA